MADVSVGSIGESFGSLRPSGAIVIGGRRFAATTEGEFVESKTRVVVIEQRQKLLVVRPWDSESAAASAGAQSRSVSGPGLPKRSLEPPQTWLERIPLAPWFAGVGVVSGLGLAVRGALPWSMELAALPLAGFVAGMIFKYSVSIPHQLAGPYEDNRVGTYCVGVVVLLLMAIGWSLGWGLYGSAIAASLGWCAGAFAGLIVVTLYVLYGGV